MRAGERRRRCWWGASNLARKGQKGGAGKEGGVDGRMHGEGITDEPGDGEGELPRLSLPLTCAGPPGTKIWI